jgi:hypothetical protein
MAEIAVNADSSILAWLLGFIVYRKISITNHKHELIIFVDKDKEHNL